MQIWPLIRELRASAISCKITPYRLLFTVLEGSRGCLIRASQRYRATLRAETTESGVESPDVEDRVPHRC